MKRLLVSFAISANLVAACLLMQGCSKKQAAAPETQLPEEQPPVEVQPIEQAETGAKATAAKNGATVKPAQVETAPIDVQSIGGTTSYTIAKGDTVSSIAYRYGVRWQDIVAVNPGLSPNKMRVGQVIQLPGKVNVAEAKHVPGTVKSAPAATAAKTTAPKTTATAAAATGATTVYIVKKGDMLSGIAHKHGVKLAALRTANPKLKGDKIFVGQKLNIPAGAKTAAVAAPAAKKGAAVSKTAAKPAAKTAKAAPKASEKSAAKAASTTAPAVSTNAAKPAAATEVKSATPAAAAAPAEVKAETAKPAETKSADNSQTYTVKEGEDVYAVAIRWGVSPSDLKSLNNLTSNELKAGQVLKLPANAQ